MLSRIKLTLAIVPGSKVLGLQLIQGLNHPRDEVLVLPLLHNMTSAIVLSSIVRDISAGMVLDSKTGSELDNAKDTPDLGPWHAGVEALVDA